MVKLEGIEMRDSEMGGDVFAFYPKNKSHYHKK